MAFKRPLKVLGGVSEFLLPSLFFSISKNRDLIVLINLSSSYQSFHFHELTVSLPIVRKSINHVRIFRSFFRIDLCSQSDI